MKTTNSIYCLNKTSIEGKNKLFIMRDDLIPYSFGGNKARKAMYFFEDILSKNADYVITYGSASSNHCRVISNLCKQHNLGCTIITTEGEVDSFNRNMSKLFGAEIIYCDIQEVRQTIDEQINIKKKQNYNPYFIQGGGHGNIGTQAYVDAYEEIKKYEEENLKFDYIFLASGTGTTQAGLIIGNKINQDTAKVIGISIARKKTRGKDVIFESVQNFIKEKNLNLNINYEDILFIDDYVLDGYGKYNNEIENVIIEMLEKNGIPLDTTYTGKAVWGMKEYIQKNNISNSNILFIHTGGTPIFFDFLRGLNK